MTSNCPSLTIGEAVQFLSERGYACSKYEKEDLQFPMDFGGYKRNKKGRGRSYKKGRGRSYKKGRGRSYKKGRA